MVNENPSNFAGNAAAFQAARLAESEAAMALGNQYVKTMHNTMGETLQQWPDMMSKMNSAALSSAPGSLQFAVAAKAALIKANRTTEETEVTRKGSPFRVVSAFSVV
jgi:hypothetical protein